ncbi:sensor histidine kinase [Neorhizobium sp. NCHU2750]|uniref:sensor histidine kinase n=1 Tax=Neorhizobium sp. NCHU2750 TaxID=1825976 RepID=UPI000E764FDA|nr:histidine kinase [Neorhizobium sp. NCHU2750]
MRLPNVVAHWNGQSLARQFLLAGGFVSIVAIAVVGAFVASLIEEAVTRNSAASTALYVDSIIAPILPDMTTTEKLDESVERALDETLSQGALGQRLVSFRLWRKDGTILYANDKKLMGQKLQPSDDLKAAFSGKMVSEFNDIDPQEATTLGDAKLPLLKIYNPILQPWSGEVVAVSEFYEVASDFERSLYSARLRAWLAVAAVIAGIFALLSLIVLRGSRLIDLQRGLLNARVGELSHLLKQNRALHERVHNASQRTTALNERFLRRLGADLHDGPAQLIAYASLRIDSPAILGAQALVEKREAEVASIKMSLQEAMREIRSICHDLILPEIESAGLHEVISQAVQRYQERTGITVDLLRSHTDWQPSPAEKICIYRFVQETLNNGFRHAGGAGQQVLQRLQDDCVIIDVIDKGPGFDLASVKPTSLGIAGLRERIESLGGGFSVLSGASGTTVTISLKTSETEKS